MGWLPVLFSLVLLAAGTAWFFHYVKGRVSRAGAIYHIFERLGRYRFEGLDAELRGILKEKGLREQDPFDEVVARAHVVDLLEGIEFEQVARRAATLLAERIPVGADHILDGFLRGTRVGATPVSRGTALPHLRLPGLETPEMVVVRAQRGVQMDVVDEFGEPLAPDQPVEALFFLVSSEENPSQHLRILAQLAGRVDDEDFLEAWRHASTDQELKEILLRDERYLSVVVREGTPAGALAGLALRETAFPEGCLVAIVRRGELTFVPRGDTVLGLNDRLTVIGDPRGIALLRGRFLRDCIGVK
jgi:mannitol/fructose-specific phosphotransferase system IIA component (Ntr-type)